MVHANLNKTQATEHCKDGKRIKIARHTILPLSGRLAGEGPDTYPSWMNSSRAAHSDTSWGESQRRATYDRMGSRSSAPLLTGTHRHTWVRTSREKKNTHTTGLAEMRESHGEETDKGPNRILMGRKW